MFLIPGLFSVSLSFLSCAKLKSVMLIWTFFSYSKCLSSFAFVITVTALFQKTHLIDFTSGFSEHRTESALLRSKSGPHMIAELSLCTVSMLILMQLSVIPGWKDAKQLVSVGV